VGLGLVGRGPAPLFQGSAFYPNYWGGAVFAPIAVSIGEVVMLVAIFQRRQNRHEASRPKFQHHQ